MIQDSKITAIMGWLKNTGMGFITSRDVRDNFGFYNGRFCERLCEDQKYSYGYPKEDRR